MEDRDEMGGFDNPYAPPSSPPGQTNELCDSEQMRAFVGPRADYYLSHFAKGRNGAGTGFNWAAFLLCGLWLGYRKMYRVTLIFFGVIWIETILEEVIMVGMMEMPESPVGSLVSLVAAVIVGTFGNRWYQNHARRVISQECGNGMPPNVVLENLSRRGGTSFVSSILLFLGFLVVLTATVIAVEVALFYFSA